MSLKVTSSFISAIFATSILLAACGGSTCARRLPLRHEADQRIEHDDDDDHDGLGDITERDCDPASRDELNHDQAFELMNEDREG